MKKIKKRAKTPSPSAAPKTPLAGALQDVAGPILAHIGLDPVPATMTWAMGVVATAWNASRNPVESEGLRQLDTSLARLATPAFSDEAVLSGILEEVFHLARVRHPRDPRFAVKVFVDKRGPSDFHVEVVTGVPKRDA